MSKKLKILALLLSTISLTNSAVSKNTDTIYAEKIIARTEKERAIFTKEENEDIKNFVNEYKENFTYSKKGMWKMYADSQGNKKTPRQYRDHWINVLAPRNREPFSTEEDKLLTECVNNLGTKWAKISKLFQGRTSVDLKHRFTKLKKLSKQKKAKYIVLPDISNFPFPFDAF